MKYCFFIFIFCSSIFAKESSKNSNISSIIPKASVTSQKEVIIIEPNQRAQDFTQAYDIIKKGKSPQSIFFHLSDGTTITNIVEMTPMTNGTLVLFKVMTNMGTKYELASIENIVNISQQ